MQVWHLTTDAPRSPHRVSPGEWVILHTGTWPIEPGQSVWVTYRVEHLDGTTEEGRVEAVWQRNEGVNSCWHAEVGPFAEGDRVTYTVHGRSPEGEAVGPTASFRVGPKLYLAILWHQHQPVYKDASHPGQKGSYIHPWVRLHAIRWSTLTEAITAITAMKKKWNIRPTPTRPSSGPSPRGSSRTVSRWTSPCPAGRCPNETSMTCWSS